MKKLLFVLSLSVLFIGCSQVEPKKIEIKEKKKISDLILKIPIHIEDSGYSNFKTLLITKQEELDKFIKSVKTQKGWKRKENFLNTIQRAEIDFSKANFLIYRLSEQSDLIVLAVDVPTSIGKSITVSIGKEKLKAKLEKELNKERISEYALAYRVNKSAKDIIFADGDRNITIENKETKKYLFKPN